MDNTNARESFIGRAREIEEFTQWLINKDPEAPRILSLYAADSDPHKQGGVGKTYLLREFSVIAKQKCPGIAIAHVDFFDIASRDGIVIAQSVVNSLKEAYPVWDISHTEEALKKYELVLYKGEDVVETRNLLADALIEDLRWLDDKIKSTDKRLLIFFDTYELVEDNPLAAVLRLSLSHRQTFPDDYDLSNIGIVIAGRREIDFKHINWRGREKEVQKMPIHPFTLSETEAYFEMLAKVNISAQPGEIKALHERTEGRPILIGLVNDVLTQQISTLKELISISKPQFEEKLVTKIDDLERPIDQIVLYMAHAYHRFNFTLLNWIWRESETDSNELVAEVDIERIAPQLQSLSFVRRPNAGTDFVLHDEMRPLVERYCWDRLYSDGHTRKDLSQYVIKYYEHVLKHNIPPEQLKQAYIVELLYHKLYVDLESGYTYFSEHFSRAVNLRLTSFSRSLLREVQQFKKQMSKAQLYDLKYNEARQVQKEEEPKQVLTLLKDLEQADQQWLEEHRADILFEKGVAYHNLSLYPEAIACFQDAMQIENKRDRSEYAYLLIWLGSVYKKQGDFETALRYYEEGLDIQKQLHNKRACASTFANISEVYRLQGKLDQALLRAHTSWHIRNEFFKKGEISEIQVGESLCLMGKVYYDTKDLAKAETAFQGTLDIFTRTGDKRGLATVYNWMGKLFMDREPLPYTRRWFNEALSTSLDIDPQSQAISLNMLGWLSMREEQYQKAIDLLQQAVALAREKHDAYQQAEFLIDLAEALKRSGHEEESQQTRQESRDICQHYHYNYLLGLSISDEGDIYYRTPDYKKAFQSYGEACYYMAQFNDLEYNKELRKLNEALFKVPSEEINTVVDELTIYWSSHGMDESHPNLIRSCEEIRGLLGF